MAQVAHSAPTPNYAARCLPRHRGTLLCCDVPLSTFGSVTQMGCCATARNKLCCAGLSQMRTLSAGSPGLFTALQLRPIFGSIGISIATNRDVKATWFFGENSRKQWPLHKQRSNFHANVSPNVCHHCCSCSASPLSHRYLAGPVCHTHFLQDREVGSAARAPSRGYGCAGRPVHSLPPEHRGAVTAADELQQQQLDTGIISFLRQNQCNWSTSAISNLAQGWEVFPVGGQVVMGAEPPDGTFQDLLQAGSPGICIT